MVNATIVAENRHLVLRRPLDALQVKNYRTFAPMELIAVQAAADILTHDIVPIVRMRAGRYCVIKKRSEWCNSREREQMCFVWRERAGYSMNNYTKRIC